MDLILNATSLGLKPDDALPLDEKAFLLRSTHAVYDMIYRPAETALLKAAKTAGGKTASGSSEEKSHCSAAAGRNLRLGRRRR